LASQVPPQHHLQLAYGVVNTSNGKIIAVFLVRVCDNRCREELGIHDPSTLSELYTLFDECARVEEGRLALEHAAQAANDPVPTDKTKEMRKRTSKQVLVAEPGPLVATDKQIKPDAPVVAAATPT
jgi:hypothetical protein